MTMNQADLKKPLFNQTLESLTTPNKPSKNKSTLLNTPLQSKRLSKLTEIKESLKNKRNKTETTELVEIKNTLQTNTTANSSINSSNISVIVKHNKMKPLHRIS
jgi:hypothetical protein